MNESHYDVLGVPRNATPAQIKAAYRKLSSSHHPDRVGENARMPLINKAYEVLSNSEKRARYDLTGDDEILEELAREAQNYLSSGFESYLTTDDDHPDPVGVMHIMIADNIRANHAQRAQHQKSLDRLQRRAKKIRHRRGAAKNLFSVVLDDQIKKVRRAIVNCERLIAVAEKAKELLTDFESTPPERQQPNSIFGGFLGGGGGL